MATARHDDFRAFDETLDSLSCLITTGLSSSMNKVAYH